MSSFRSRGTKKWKREKVRHYRRGTIYQQLRKMAVLTLSGPGVILCNINKYGFRQFVIRLDNGKVGFFNQYDVFDIKTGEPIRYDYPVKRHRGKTTHSLRI
jgi:hypothetical protein